ncbi:MAG: TMEM175 family protein [Acidobacteriota bacterium]
MGKGRLEAFSDGVIAIIITIMVLELKVPHGAELADLEPIAPLFLSYLLSFTIIGIYWNGHHHMLHVAKRVDARIMWLNLHLLFWLSLIPVVTAWVGEHPRASVPASLYGVVFLLAAVAYNLLQRAIRAGHADDEAIARVLGRTTKGTISELMYASAIGLAFVHPWIADAVYVAVAVMWFIPDRQIAQVASRHEP